MDLKTGGSFVSICFMTQGKWYLNGSVPGSGFKVQGLQPIETAENIDQNPGYLP